MNGYRKYTVVGIDGCTDQRYFGHHYAADPDDAEQQAVDWNPDLMIAAVFDGHLSGVDVKACALTSSRLKCVG